MLLHIEIHMVWNDDCMYLYDPIYCMPPLYPIVNRGPCDLLLMADINLILLLL